MSILHYKTVTIADGTNSDIVRPSDWGSAHNQVLNIGGNTSGTSQISGADIVWAGGNNVTLSANGSTVTIVGPNTVAQTVQTQVSGNIAGAGFTSTTTAGTAVVATHNSAGLSMGVPAFLTTAGATNAITTAAQSNHSHNFATTTTNGSNIVVGTANSVGATIGVPNFLTTAAATNVTSGRAGTGTTFAGTNVSASVTLDTNGLNMALSGVGGGVINQTGPNIAVAGSTITSGDVLFSNANGVTFGMNGNTITASAAGGGGAGATVPYWEPYQLGNNTSIFPLGQNTIYIQPLIPDDAVVVSNIEMQVSMATTTAAQASAVVARTFDYGLYGYGTGASSRSLTLLASSRIAQSVYCNSNVSAGYTISQDAASFTTTSAGTGVLSALSGQKYMYFPFTTTLNAGAEYFFAIRHSSASTLSSTPNRSHDFVILTHQTATSWGKWKTGGVSASNVSYLEEFDGRVYTATSSNLPNVFAESNCSVMNSKARLYLKFENES